MGAKTFSAVLVFFAALFLFSGAAFGATLVVDDDWAGFADGTVVTVEGTDYIMGTDAFATLVEAYDAAADGDTLRVMPGTYEPRMHGWVDFQINKSISVVGAGSSETVILLSDSGKTDGISIGATGVRLVGLKIVGNGEDGPSFNIRAGINVSAPPPGNTFSDLWFEDIDSSGSKGMNLALDGPYTYENVTIKNCNIHHSGNRNFYASPNVTVNGLTVTDSHFDYAGRINPDTTCIGFSLQAASVSGLYVWDCTFNENPGGGIGGHRFSGIIENAVVNHSGYIHQYFWGIGVWCDTGVTTSGIEIVNPTITNCGGRGIMLGTWGGTVSDVTVTGGTIDGSANYGVMLYAGGGGVIDDVSFAGTEISGSTSQNVLFMADGAGTSLSADLEGCDIHDPGADDIYLSGTNGALFGASIVGNRISGAEDPYAGVVFRCDPWGRILPERLPGQLPGGKQRRSRRGDGDRHGQ